MDVHTVPDHHPDVDRRSPMWPEEDEVPRLGRAFGPQRAAVSLLISGIPRESIPLLRQ